MPKNYTSLSGSHYFVSDAEAGKLAKSVNAKLPKFGYELSLGNDFKHETLEPANKGREVYLTRTPMSDSARGWGWAVYPLILKYDHRSAMRLPKGMDHASRRTESSTREHLAMRNRHVGGGVSYGDLSDTARELFLYADNEGRLYPTFKSVQANQEKHLAKNRWEREASIKGWMHFVDESAKMYAKEFGGKWHAIFPIEDRRQMAAYLADLFRSGERR